MATNDDSDGAEKGERKAFLTWVVSVLEGNAQCKRRHRRGLKRARVVFVMPLTAEPIKKKYWTHESHLAAVTPHAGKK